MIMQELDELDYRILTALGRNPLAKVVDLSEELKVNVKTLSKRLQKLVESKVLYSVSAQICPATLELEPVILFMDVKFKNIPLVEKVGEEHLYTWYSVRCLGKFNGLIMIFAIPRNSMRYLLELFDKLHEIGLIDKYVYVNSIAKWSYVECDFTYYDPTRDEWKFDWENWPQVLEKVKEEWQELKVELERTELDKKAVEHELGDLLFSLAQLARHLGIDSEVALQKANGRFRERFELMVKLSGLPFSEFNELPMDVKEQWYQMAKKATQTHGAFR